MASNRNLCQHLDLVGNQCQSNEYALCPHCQLQVCLKHLNLHQGLLRSELYSLCDEVDRVRIDLDHLIFDEVNYREYLYKQLDEWRDNQLNIVNKMHLEKRQQLQILCLKSFMEFQSYKTKKEKQLKCNLTKRLTTMLKEEEQINIDDVNEIKSKLNQIRQGLDELKQLKIDLISNDKNNDIQFAKKRYVEAEKSYFNDDDDVIWELNNENKEEYSQSSEDSLMINDWSNCNENRLPVSRGSSTLLPIIIIKHPLKLNIKRLQQSNE